MVLPVTLPIAIASEDVYSSYLSSGARFCIDSFSMTPPYHVVLVDTSLKGEKIVRVMLSSGVA